VSGFNILDHYWIFGDVNPTTQVYSSAVGAMVANNAAAYLTWLAGLDYTSDGGSGNGLPISNVENNGSGACRVTINTTAEMATGQRWRLAGVQGVSGANGTFQITVVNSTKIDLVGSTFSGAYTSGGFVLGPTFAATAASLAQVLNSAALESLVPSSNDITSAVNVTLSNPLPATTKVNMTTSGKAVTLPPMDRANSYPLSEPFTVINSGANAWDLKTNAGTILGTLAPQASWQLKNTSNASAAGSFEIIITLYNSGTQGILQVAPKTDSAAAQGDWTNLAHQSIRANSMGATMRCGASGTTSATTGPLETASTTPPATVSRPTITLAPASVHNSRFTFAALARRPAANLGRCRSSFRSGTRRRVLEHIGRPALSRLTSSTLRGRQTMRPSLAFRPTL
jgi:hypothetical protein